MIFYVNMVTNYETNSFIERGIVNSDPRLYHNQLRHYVL